jgi:hypothetical protein
VSTDSSDEEQAEHERALVVAELVRKYRLAGTLAHRGLRAIVSAPASALLGYALSFVTHSSRLFPLGLMFTTTTLVAGTVYWAGNALARRGFARRLDALDAPRQLPEARVVIR